MHRIHLVDVTLQDLLRHKSHLRNITQIAALVGDCTVGRFSLVLLFVGMGGAGEGKVHIYIYTNLIRFHSPFAHDIEFYLPLVLRIGLLILPLRLSFLHRPWAAFRFGEILFLS